MRRDTSGHSSSSVDRCYSRMSRSVSVTAPGLREWCRRRRRGPFAGVRRAHLKRRGFRYSVPHSDVYPLATQRPFLTPSLPAHPHINPADTPPPLTPPTAHTATQPHTHPRTTNTDHPTPTTTNNPSTLHARQTLTTHERFQSWLVVKGCQKCAFHSLEYVDFSQRFATICHLYPPWSSRCAGGVVWQLSPFACPGRPDAAANSQRGCTRVFVRSEPVAERL